MSTALTTDVNPGVLMTRATDVAGVCGEIVKRTAQVIQGRKYVRVEGWQSIAAAYGCVASATNVRKVEGGVRATGQLFRMSDGVLIATAEGFVGEDEPTWFGGPGNYGKMLPKRPDFAIQAMAQTRAISRVCRSAFAFVVVMIDGNLSTTPAEEMAAVIEHDADAKHATSQPSPQSVPPAAAGGVPLSASQERLIRAKLSAAKLTEEALMAEYKEWSLTPKEGRVLVPKGAVNEILEWIEQSKPI